MLADLLSLQHDGAEAGTAQCAAVEKEPQAAWPARPGPPEVHAGEAAGPHLQAAFLPHLPPAGIPWCLAVGLHDAAGDRPPGLVSRLQYQQPARPVEDQRSGGCGDGREEPQLGFVSARRI